MGRRLGTGAAAASAIIFSVLLLSDLALFASSGDRARMYTQADYSDMLGDQAAVLVGAVSMDALLKVQSFLASNTLNCSSASGAVAGFVGGLGGTERVGSLSATVSSIVSPPSTSGDNLSIVSPFNGSVRGDLNVALRLSVTSAARQAGVTFKRVETHLAHLPVHLDSAVSACLDSVATVESSVVSATPSNCTSAAVFSIMEELGKSLESRYGADGFQLGLVYMVHGQSPCSVAYGVSVEQLNIQGPGGSFNLRLEGDGIASFQ